MRLTGYVSNISCGFGAKFGRQIKPGERGEYNDVYLFAVHGGCTASTALR